MPGLIATPGETPRVRTMFREPVEVRLGLHVDRDAAGARVDVLVDGPERLLDHQVDVERDFRRLRERLRGRSGRRSGSGRTGRPSRRSESRRPPPVSHAATASARRPKSAERRDGAIRTGRSLTTPPLAEATTKESDVLRVTGEPAWRELAEDRPGGRPLVGLPPDAADPEPACLERDADPLEVPPDQVGHHPRGLRRSAIDEKTCTERPAKRLRRATRSGRRRRPGREAGPRRRPAPGAPDDERGRGRAREMSGEVGHPERSARARERAGSSALP